MIGKYDIEIYNNSVHYSLSIKRNITILQGYSATGKTELIRLISQFESFGDSSGVTIICDVPCRVITNVNWYLNIKAAEKSIIFIDENVGFTHSKEFAEVVKKSDNYFVIVSRDDLHELPYSVDEIYGLRDVTSSQKYKSFYRVYNEMYKLYDFSYTKEIVPELILTEDSNSGFEFFDKLSNCICISAAGKSKIDSILRQHDESMLVIVDGAAFGSEIGKIIRYIKTNKKNCIIYAPESFEFLLLCSNIFDVPQSILDETYDYADSKEYMSWERFYTKYLTDISQGTVFQYSKGKLNRAFLTKGSIQRIVENMPELMRKLTKDDLEFGG